MKNTHLYSVKLKRRKDLLQGIIIDSGLEWTLFNEVPVDYLIDGYLLIRNKYIESFTRSEDEIFREKIIKSKISISDLTINMPLNNLFDLLEFFMKNEIIIQIDLHDDTVMYLGIITNIFRRTIKMKSLLPSGTWGNQDSYIIENIRTIRFNNDYIFSLEKYNQTLVNISN